MFDRARMVSDGGGGFSGDADDVVAKFNDAITKLKNITQEQLQALVQIDNNVSSTSVMMNAITKRIEELENARDRFAKDAAKINSVRNRFGI